MAYIANLKYGSWQVRLHFAWSGSGNADKAFGDVLHLIESTIGPSAKDQQTFLQAARRAFQKAGFNEVRA